MAIRVEAARWRKRRAGFLRWGTHRSERWRSMARGPRASHHTPRCPRVHLHRFVPGLPANWRWPIHAATVDFTGAPAPHATTDRPPLDVAYQTTIRTTDSHRQARPARLASSASTPTSSSRRPGRRPPPDRSPNDGKATPSLSHQRSELRSPDRGRDELVSLFASR